MNLDSVRCGFFASLNRKGGNRSILEILRGIKNGEWRAAIERLRSLVGSDYERAKRHLPAFMVSASTVNGCRKAANLGPHTGLMQIDIDGLPDLGHAVSIRARLAADPHVLACWISPGGKGVKAIVPIEADHQGHKACFRAAKLRFKEKLRLDIDKSCSDPGRLCFVSYDPDLVLKEVAIPFDPSLSATEEPATGQPPDSSSPSSASTSTSTHYHLHHTVFADYPGLNRFYQTLVVERVGKVTGGLRNDALVEIIPVLYSAIALRFILPFAEELYTQHQSTFRDPLDQHLNEAHSLLEGCERDYVGKRLTDAEASHYTQLTDRQQTVFRICHALSGIQSDECPPPFFFLSAEKLGHRLGALDAAAHRELHALCRRGILRIVQTGTRRTKGQPGRATRYEWLLPSRAGEHG